MPDKSIHIVVLLREVCDPRPPVRLTADGFGVRDRGLRRIANPADLSALEQALQFAAAKQGTVTALTIGPRRTEDLLRQAIAIGAQRAIRVWDTALVGGDCSADARLLARLMEILKPDFFFTGNRLIDQGAAPVPALAASKLGIPYVTAVLSVAMQDGEIEVLRKCDRGARQRVGIKPPCTLLVEDSSCEPRYPHKDTLLPSLQAPIEQWGIPELGLPFSELGSFGSRLGKERCSFPRKNPRRVVTPDANLPAFERILALLSGGIKPREGKLSALSAAETADKMMAIFQAEGLFGGAES
ncbi:MAG: electron transfer flavoprotein subunit beta [Desulfuromonadales bacterium]|nr:electron transfer flavoprotein subunit beta [Desulfuromonadales bacterium]